VKILPDSFSSFRENLRTDARRSGRGQYDGTSQAFSRRDWEKWRM